MSYDVDIRVKVEGVDRYIPVVDYDVNITWNVRELILRSSGWDIQNEASNGPVEPWRKMITNGLHELITNPAKYKKYESPNGWGTINGVIKFYRACLEMCDYFFQDYEDLKDVAVVWVS